MSGTDCCSVHSMVMLVRLEAGRADLGGQGGRVERLVEQAERRQVDGVAARRPAGCPLGRLEPPDWSSTVGDDVDVELDAAVVLIAAWTTEPIDCGSIGMSGRNRHSYSYSSPVASLTIGWKANVWSFRRLKK